ncbi:putative F-box/FBD/LRR-repeat protein At4g03220 [Corylus avellana]|uniref:putative F-box/FBD/LRR-repeat protein At4g03220 n=1 Tax=Corylus avellana TaxID=13451 RepID=UPI00286C8C19|nr:putative F-box/FBD/LRR-repeat protein At4g03220 [Corylus avellana]
METRVSRGRELLLEEAVEDKEDRISNLSDDILHHILSFLPVQSVAKTSLLSTRWNYLWATTPCLDFSGFSIKEKRHERKGEDMELIKRKGDDMFLIIKTVLAGRHPNFNIKVFRFKGNLGCAYLRDCIRQVVRHSVEELELDVSMGGEICYLPTCIFSCDSLKSFTLKTQDDRVASFRFYSYNVTGTSGLRSLQALSLKHVNFMDSNSAAIFSGSSFPALKRLTLNNCMGINPRLDIGCRELEDLQVEDMKINYLDISGERLKNLRVISSYLTRKNGSWVKIFAPNLETFCWENNQIPEKCEVVHSFPFLRTCRINIVGTGHPFILNATISFLSNLVTAPDLYIDIQQSAKIFSAIQFKGCLPSPFLNLRTLAVLTGLNKSEIPGIVFLLRNAPLLHALKLEIVGFHYECSRTSLDYSSIIEQLWENEAQALRSFFNHLKVLKIHVQFLVCECVIIATRFLLEQGNALQEVALTSNHYAWKEESIFGFLRGSLHAKISID